MFWNLPREFDGALGADIQAVYRDLAPTLEPLTTQWPLDETLGEIDASDRFDIATKVTVPWTQPYSRDRVRRAHGHALEPPHAR